MARDCGYEEPPDDLPAPTVAESDPGYAWRAVRLDSQVVDELFAIVYFPSDPDARAYEDGAPVVVGARSALFSGFLATPLTPSAWGLVEVQPLYPGWVYGAYASSGVSDAAGPIATAVLAETIAFAAGQARTVDDLSLRQLTGAPVCNGGVVISANSTGIIHTALALEGFPDGLDEAVLAVAAAESPHLPQVVTGDLGFTGMDPDDRVDGDGNGVTWDDFRHPSYAPGDCDGVRCAIDYSDLAWERDLTLWQVFGDYYEGFDTPGLLYQDSNRNLRLDLSATGSFDLDGDGALGPGEDWPLQAWYDADGPPRSVVYSPEATTTADGMGVLQLDDWPAHVADPRQSSSFWGERSLMGSLPGIIDAAPEHFSVYFTFTEIDHGLAQASRPHIAEPYQALREGGVSVRYNLGADAMSCLVDPELSEGWGGELPWNEDLGEGEIGDWALPETIPNDSWRALGAAGALWEYLGPFDRCAVPG